MTDQASKTDFSAAAPETTSSVSVPSPESTGTSTNSATSSASAGSHVSVTEAAIAGDPAGAAGAAEKDACAKGSPESGFWGLLQSLVVTIIIALFIITFVVQAFQIPSQSMENTLLVGDYLLVDKARFGPARHWSWLMPYEPIHRGDIVVFRYPVDPDKHFVKRVVGIPGDRLHLHEGRLYVNDQLQDEPFAIHTMSSIDRYRDEFPNGIGFHSELSTSWWHEMPEHVRHGELVVPPNSYFVLGDNRDNSLDSRYWGFVPRENIVGRPLFIYFSHEVVWEAPASGFGDTLARLVSILGHFAESVRWNRTLRVIR